MKAYIIGNGKSLTASDLDLLVGRQSFACNRINLIYPHTKWRPDVYVHPESLVPDQAFILENVRNGALCYVGEHFQITTPRIEDAPNIKWIKDCHHHMLNFDNKDVLDEWHFPQPCTFGGSVNYCMQVAVLMGYNELILLGCDLEYRDTKPSHFDKAYEWGGENTAFYRAKNAVWGHVTALNYIRRRKLNVSIYNATRGGLLDIWPRVTLEDTL